MNKAIYPYFLHAKSHQLTLDGSRPKRHEQQQNYGLIVQPGALDASPCISAAYMPDNTTYKHTKT